MRRSAGSGAARRAAHAQLPAKRGVATRALGLGMPGWCGLVSCLLAGMHALARARLPNPPPHAPSPLPAAGATRRCTRWRRRPCWTARRCCGPATLATSTAAGRTGERGGVHGVGRAVLRASPRLQPAAAAARGQVVEAQPSRGPPWALPVALPAPAARLSTDSAHRRTASLKNLAPQAALWRPCRARGKPD